MIAGLLRRVDRYWLSHGLMLTHRHEFEPEHRQLLAALERRDAGRCGGAAGSGISPAPAERLVCWTRRLEAQRAEAQRAEASRRMSKVLSMRDAIARHVRDGDTVVIEGFTHLICFAAGHEIIRQGRRDLVLCRLTPDLVYDQMIEAGCRPEAGLLLGGQSRRRLAARLPPGRGRQG